MLTKNQYSRQGRPPYFSNFVVLTMGSTSKYLHESSGSGDVRLVFAEAAC